MTTKAISRLIDSDNFRRVLDLGEPIDDIITTLQEHWEYNIEDRRPGPAYVQNDELQPTDLDLACLLSTLAKRKAVVILPRYMGDGTTKKASSNGVQTVLSADNRRGQITRLTSNQDYFSFSMAVNDQNVMNTATGQLGAPRNFLIIGKDGRWHPGWDTIKFAADAKENDFIAKFNLAVNGDMAFKQFVHPGRRASFFGQYYFLTKTVIQRLEEEARALRAEIKAVKVKQAKAEKFHFERDDTEDSFGKTTVRVPIFTAEVDVPFVGNPLTDPQALDEMEARLKTIDYGYLPSLRFATRATELAFYKGRGEQGGIPTWSKASFGDMNIKRTHWRVLKYGQTMFGHDVALRYRIRAKEVEVASGNTN